MCIISLRGTPLFASLARSVLCDHATYSFGRSPHAFNNSSQNLHSLSSRVRRPHPAPHHLPHSPFSALNLSHASFNVLNTAALIIRCSVVASVGIYSTPVSKSPTTSNDTSQRQ